MAISKTLGRIFANADTTTLTAWADRDLTADAGSLVRLNDGPILALVKTYHALISVNSFDATTVWRVTLNGTNYDVSSPATALALFTSLDTSIDGLPGFYTLSELVVDGAGASELFIWSNTEFTIATSIVSGVGTWNADSTSTLAEYVPYELYKRGIVWEHTLDVSTVPAGAAGSDGRWGISEIGTGTVTNDVNKIRIVATGAGNSASLQRIQNVGGNKVLDATADRVMYTEVSSITAAVNSFGVAMAFYAPLSAGDIGCAIDTSGDFQLLSWDNYNEGLEVDIRVRTPIWGINSDSPEGAVFWATDGSMAGGGLINSGGFVFANIELIGTSKTTSSVDIYVYKALSGILLAA